MTENNQEKRPYIFIIMGVSGSGKTTIGKLLAKDLDCNFYDGDDFHPPENIAKMAAGIPLNDADRWPWLAILAGLIEKHWQRNEGAVIACSALKQSYRDKLRIHDNVQFIYLEGRFDVIWSRMQDRKGHYMKPEMLKSQFITLEEPNKDEAYKVSIDQDLGTIMSQIEEEIAKWTAIRSS